MPCAATMRYASSVSLAVLIALLLSCSGSAPAQGIQPPAPSDGGAGPEAGPAEVPLLPLVPYQGGHVIAHLKLVTITFEGFPFQADVQAFGDWIVSSEWLQTVGQEYGVGTGSHIAKLALRYTPPAVVGAPDIEQYLAYGITSGVFPKPDPDTLYVIYYPSTTKPSGLGCDGPWWGHRTVTVPVRFTSPRSPPALRPQSSGGRSWRPSSRTPRTRSSSL
jgi:hypothetical protein